tara:strand:- start:506 stop:859 length:354 start_codon:yes stop_codon:yes gene_type:complete
LESIWRNYFPFTSADSVLLIATYGYILTALSRPPFRDNFERGQSRPSHTKQRASVSFADIAFRNTDTPKWSIANYAKARFWNATGWTIQTGCNRTTKSGPKDTTYCTKLKRTKTAGS